MEEKTVFNLSETFAKSNESGGVLPLDVNDNGKKQEDDRTKTRKTILRMRSFDLHKESLKIKSLSKTKSWNEQDCFRNNLHDHTNEETRFPSIYESSSLTSEGHVLDPLRLTNLESDPAAAFVEEDSDLCSWRKLHIDEPAFAISLKFEDVNYKVRMKENNNSNVEKCILQGVSGSVFPGEVLALMGPSGGGKTTLLNLLSGRLRNNGGIITYNDQLYTKSLKRRIGFVLQDDTVFPHLTVKETLTYSALLRLPNTLSKEEKEERAMNVILELGLERCQNTMIGGNFVRGVSGGERKRVCIGNEILLNPSLLFLDEPTSSLDSTTALRIIQMLHNMAQAGKTVVTTIHQPSSRLFSKFDKLILLSNGCSLYFGKASEAMPYFSSIGCLPIIAMNPAEFLIDLANGNMKHKSIPSQFDDKFLESENEGPSFADVHEYLLGAYESRASKMEKIKTDELIVLDDKVVRENKSDNAAEAFGASWSAQFCILFKRGLKERRHEYLSSLRIIQVISMAIIVGLLWWNSNASSPKMVQDQAGLLFFISVFWAFFPVFTAIFTFPQERAMLAKERSVDMYRLSAYLIARNTSDLPLDLLLPAIFLAIIYFMVGLKPTFPAFLLTLLTIFLSIVAAQGLGLTIGAAFLDVKTATTMASVTIMTFILSAGFFIKKIPRFISWIRYTSLNYHTHRLLLMIQYSCSGEKSLKSEICESPLIKRQGVYHGGAEVGAMLVMIIGYRLLTYVFLRRMQLRT